MFTLLVRRVLPLLVLGGLTLSSCVVRQYGPPPPRYYHHRGYYGHPGPPPPPGRY